MKLDNQQTPLPNQEKSTKRSVRFSKSFSAAWNLLRIFCYVLQNHALKNHNSTKEDVFLSLYAIYNAYKSTVNKNSDVCTQVILLDNSIYASEAKFKYATIYWYATECSSQ